MPWGRQVGPNEVLPVSTMPLAPLTYLPLALPEFYLLFGEPRKWKVNKQWYLGLACFSHSHFPGLNLKTLTILVSVTRGAIFTTIKALNCFRITEQQFSIAKVDGRSLLCRGQSADWQQHC